MSTVELGAVARGAGSGVPAVLAAGSAGAFAARAGDDDAVDWARRAGPSSSTRVGDVFGSAAVQGGSALATYAVGKLTHKPAVTHVGGDLIRAHLVAGIFTHALKYSVDRTRPGGGRHSMPSGHTSATFVSATVLGQHFGWKAGVPAYAIAGFVAYTRVRDLRHYPTDDVVGATIGIVAGTTVTRGHRAWTIAPVKTAGGMAVYWVRIW